MSVKDDIWQFLEEESVRINYGKLFIEATVAAGRITNIQAETKRSKNINH